MEITVTKDELVRELGIAQGVLERKSTMPILSNVLLKASGGGVELSATDLEVSLRARLNASVKGEGAAAVHGRTLFDVVRSAPGEEISMRLDGDKFLLEGGKFRTQLLSMPEGDFPVLQNCAMEDGRSVPASVIKGLILRTLYAVAQEETRFSVRGALLVLEGAKAAMVATDGHRLALSEAVLPDSGEAIRVLVHKKALSELLKLCDMASGDVLVAQRDNHVFFRVGHRDLVSRLMDVSFPSYEKVIPTDNNQAVVLEREVFLQSLRRVSLLANEKSRAVKFRLASGILAISTLHSERGEAADEIGAEYDGAPMEISFNGQYVMDFLGSINCASVKIALKSEKHQGMFVPAGDEGFDTRCVIMPMRL